MAKTRALVKRRKSVRNIRKITKTMQMISTAKFQKALKRAVASEPFVAKVRELTEEVVVNGGEIDHPLLRRPTAKDQRNHVALLVIVSNRGLAGAYNGNVLRAAAAFFRKQKAAGVTVDVHVVGKKAISYLNFIKFPIAGRHDGLADAPPYAKVAELGRQLMDEFTSGRLDGVYVAYTNFISTGRQRAEVLPILPLMGARALGEWLAKQAGESQSQAEAGALDAKRMAGEAAAPAPILPSGTVYDFSPGPKELLDEMLPLSVNLALYQCFADAQASEHVARMIAMKSATDSADKMIRALTMKYNRARQNQITTELAEIMGGVEAMKK
jgi:F-type H+-transporting ATPase subunit gamma